MIFVTNLPSERILREHIAAFMVGWNRSLRPFEWTKPARAIIPSHRRMLDRLSTAVHLVLLPRREDSVVSEHAPRVGDGEPPANGTPFAIGA